MRWFVSHTLTPASAPPVRVEADQQPDGRWRVVFADATSDVWPDERFRACFTEEVTGDGGRR